jgi:hypothetical protein
MHGSAATSCNPVVAALRIKRACEFAPLQVANGLRTDPGPQVASEAPALAARAAWAPLLTGQSVPMIGEAVDDQSCFDE